MRIQGWPRMLWRRVLPWTIAGVIAAALVAVVAVMLVIASDRRSLSRQLDRTRNELFAIQSELREARGELSYDRAEISGLKWKLAAPTRAGLHDKQMQIAFLRGSYPHGSSVVVASLRGRERVLLHSEVDEFNWSRRGTALLGPDFEISPAGERHAKGDLDNRCLSSPDPAPDRTRIECVGASFTLHRPGRKDVFYPDIGEDNVANAEPALSRDGKWFAHVTWGETDPASYDVAIINTRHTGHWWTEAPSDLWWKEYLSWSPDGKRLAFMAVRRNLDPLWNSDGTKHEYDPLHGASEAVVIVNSQGHVLARIANAARPAWSPDGKQIAFDSGRSGRRQIYIANGDGSNVRQLTHSPRASWHPRWRWVH